MENRSFRQLLRMSFKSEDTEEWLDVHFTRPVGLAIALVCEKLRIHPNAITIVSIFLGLGAGYMFYFTDLQHNICGIVLLMMANFLDSADGQLARLTNQKTLIGRMLDGFSGDAWFFAIYLAIVLRIFCQPIPLIGVNWGIWGFILCVIAGFVCHSRQSSLADYYRQIHLYFLLGKKGSELDNSKAQDEILKQLKGKGHFWDRKFYYNYRNYCYSQEKRTPEFQRFFQVIKTRYPNAEDMPEDLRNDFRKGSLPLMKYTNLLTFNTRAILIYITCLLNVPYIYPLMEVSVYVAIYIHMKRSHELHCHGMFQRYCL